MVERFVSSSGTITVANNASTVVGVGTLFSGRDRAGATVWALPAAAAAIRVGVVAEIDPPYSRGGSYNNLSLPLVSPYRGATLTAAVYELVDSLGLASGASQAAIYARFVAFLEQNMGLVGNTSDDINYALVPNNCLFIDNVTRTIYQWRNGVLNVVEVVGTLLNPRGAYAGGTTYAKNDMVETGGYIYVSNVNTNLGNTPNTAPTSTASWMYYPTTGVGPVLDALGINSITISEDQPSGGQDGDLWFVVNA